MYFWSCSFWSCFRRPAPEQAKTYGTADVTNGETLLKVAEAEHAELVFRLPLASSGRSIINSGPLRIEVLGAVKTCQRCHRTPSHTAPLFPQEQTGPDWQSPLRSAHHSTE